MKTPSLKMPSMKTPSMTPAVQKDTGNIITNIFNTIAKNIVIILIFMLLIFAIYIIGQLININKEGEIKPIYDEKKMVLKIDKKSEEKVSDSEIQKMIDEYELKNTSQKDKNKNKWVSSFFNLKNHFKKSEGDEEENKEENKEEEKIIEGHGKHQTLKRHTGRVNEYCFGGCSEHEILEDGSKVCKSYRDGDGDATDKYKVGSACCKDMKKAIWKDHWQFDWGINASWQEKHKQWYCHCELGVPTDQECCYSWITGVVVKPGHPDSTCLPENKGKKGSGSGGRGGSGSDLYNASKCFVKGGRYNKETGDCEGGWSWPDCSFKDVKVCRKKRFGFVPKDNDYKYCHFGKCVCPSGRFGDNCEYTADGEVTGNNDPEDYNDHDPHSNNTGNHRRDRDLSDKGIIGVVGSSTGEVKAKPYKPDIRSGLEGFVESYRGVESVNCDTSFNSVRDQIQCKNWWSRICNDDDPSYCSNKTPLGEEKCLQYPCCLWEMKNHTKPPEWTDDEFTDKYGEKIEESDKINRTASSTSQWQVDTKFVNVFGVEGRCVKGTPDGGPYDKNTHMDKVNKFLDEYNEGKIAYREGAIKSREDEIRALDKDEDADDFQNFYYLKVPGAEPPEGGFKKEDYEIDMEKMNKELSGIFNDSEYKTLDEYYYTEYKHRSKGGTTVPTTFHRFLDGNAITMYPNKDGEYKDDDGKNLIEQDAYKFTKEK